MQTLSIVFVLLAALVSILLVWFQYRFSIKGKKLNWLLAMLRFLTVFCLFLLLINPKFEKETLSTEKLNLVLAIDDSESIRFLNGEASVTSVFSKVLNNEKLQEQFVIQPYAFGNRFSKLDSLLFQDKITNVSEAITSFDEVYGTDNSVLILLTDGNATVGSDYEFLPANPNTAIFPIVVGDTTQYEDIRAEQLNLNRYAFLKNQFPLEATFVYNGSSKVTKEAKVFMDNKVVFQKRLDFDAINNARTITTLISPTNVGIKNIKVQIEALPNEKNSINNNKTTAIEVIDEKIQVTIVSEMNHPDIGMFKKAIESNEQRAVSIVAPTLAESILEATDIFILYQPTRSFKGVYDFIEAKGTSSLTIAGTNTDWGFLNQIDDSFEKENLNQSEDITPRINKSFVPFSLDNISFEGYPPLKSNLGALLITKPIDVIAFQNIKGIALNEPLFFVAAEQNRKQAFLLGENIWKWRVQTYRNNRSFESFDNFLGKLFLYLSDGEKKDRLTVAYKSVYEGASNAIISASYFDKSYIFDSSASLSLTITGDNFQRQIPMLRSGNSYNADLSDLTAGEYDFSIKVDNEGLIKKGKFKILDFELEQQFLSANDDKLQRLAKRSNGFLSYPSQTDSLIDVLLSDSQYKPIQKSTKNVVSLIDVRWLLAIIVIALTSEWFIRKYNGLL